MLELSGAGLSVKYKGSFFCNITLGSVILVEVYRSCILSSFANMYAASGLPCPSYRHIVMIN